MGLQEAGARECVGKAAAGVGRRFSFHFPEPKLEVRSCLISEATRDMGDRGFTPRTCPGHQVFKKMGFPLKGGWDQPQHGDVGEGQSQHHKRSVNFSTHSSIHGTHSGCG